jgi:formylglycine-generating enzyme required for sulfatase activity
MGFSENGYLDAQPTHEVCFEQGYWIDRYEVTNAQYANCVAAGACSPLDTTQYSAATFANHPVSLISWKQAAAYAAWRDARLPTEAEWEYAARGPDALKYPWGNTFDATKLNFCDVNCVFNLRITNYDDGFSETSPGGNYPSGASWVGAFDMLGNINEWTNTIYDLERFPYPYDRADGRENEGVSTSPRVIRGCWWGCVDVVQMYAAFRSWGDPDLHYAGIRLVRDFQPDDIVFLG